jgi:cation:H+ antiporter
MSMATVLLLLAGFVALYYGAEWLVAGASEIASHLNISRSVVGLTLVAFGTSAPEFFVNVIAAADGHTEIAMANVAGSNLTNLCIGFGLTSMVVVVPLLREKFLTDLIFLMITPMIVMVALLVTNPSVLPVAALIPFSIALIWYLVSLFRRRKSEDLDLPTKHDKIIIPLGTFVLGACALYLGGELVFHNSVDLATAIGVSESVIGLTIVAFGTSIPDVTASVVAARRGELDIAAGNLIGSNISNILVVLGATLIAAGGVPLAAKGAILIDYGLVCLLTTIFVCVMIRTQRLTRVMGSALLLTFLVYVSIRVMIAFWGS